MHESFIEYVSHMYKYVRNIRFCNYFIHIQDENKINNIKYIYTEIWKDIEWLFNNAK
jgi:hypothetical protein